MSRQPRSANADSWGLPRVLDFFDHRRDTTDAVYPSEWHFLKDALKEGISVLDVGCAQGGFAAILGEHLSDFRYTGVDINEEMVARARKRHPGRTFHQVMEGDLSVLGEERFDLVLVFGILHLHQAWRDTLATAWQRTAGTLLFDLREIDGPSVEDIQASYFRMDFAGDQEQTDAVLPYNLINTAEARDIVTKLCAGASRVSQYGYPHPVSSSAVTPVEQAMITVYRVER